MKIRNEQKWPESQLFIPTFNAARHIKSVTGRIPAELWSQLNSIYIINDGSTDSTASVIESIGKEDLRIKLFHFPKNRGYGPAVKYGLELCRDDGCEYAVCVHADGQYPPEQITEIVDKMGKEQVDIMQGSRIASGTALSGGMPPYKYVAGKLLTVLENLVFGLHLTDYHSGFLFYSRRALQTLLFENLSSSFDFDLEVIASARTLGLSINEYPIPTRYADEVSYLNPVTYGLRVLMVLVKYMRGIYKNV